MLHELAYKDFFHKSDCALLRGVNAEVVDVILGLDEAEVKEFKDVVLEAVKLHALAATTAIGQNYAYEVAYFKVIRSIERLNLAKSTKFSEKLREAINMYHSQAITNTEMLEMLLRLAKEINSSDNREDEFGLTREEMAFYDALIHISSVEEIMKHEDLVTIAREVAITIRKNKTIDWNSRSTALPKMRREIKRLLAKHGYPPNKQNDALAYVMLQVEKTADRVPVFVDYADQHDGELLIAEDTYQKND
ncbi:MAG: type I restriction enzyme endonuclease domain-containing protein [Culicoidibacterales bacterium]